MTVFKNAWNYEICLIKAIIIFHGTLSWLVYFLRFLECMIIERLHGI